MTELTTRTKAYRAHRGERRQADAPFLPMPHLRLPGSIAVPILAAALSVLSIAALVFSPWTAGYVAVTACFVLGAVLPAGHAIVFALAVRSLVPATEAYELTSVLLAVDVIVIGYTARQLIAWLTGRVQPLTPSSWWLWATLSWAALSSVLHDVALSPIVRLLGYSAVFAFPPSSDRDVRTLRRGVVLLALVQLGISLPELGTRLVGAGLGDPHQTGLLLLAALAVLLLDHHVRRSPRTVFAAVFIVGIAATRTRGIWLAGIVMLVAWWITRRRPSARRTAVAVLAVATIGLLSYGPLSDALGLNPESASVRRASIDAGVEATIDSPTFGEGWAAGADRSESAPPPAYNLFVNVAAAGGVPALLALVGFLVSVTKASARAGPNGAAVFWSGFLALSLFEMTIYAGAFGTLLTLAMMGDVGRSSSAGLRPPPQRQPATEGLRLCD